MNIDIVNQNLAKAGVDKIKNKVSDTSEQKELKDACAGFEAIFMNSMIKSMRKTLPGNALFKESNSMNIYKSMYDQHLSEQLSKSHKSLGVKEFLYQQLKKSL